MKAETMHMMLFIGIKVDLGYSFFEQDSKQL